MVRVRGGDYLFLAILRQSKNKALAVLQMLGSNVRVESCFPPRLRAVGEVETVVPSSESVSFTVLCIWS